LPNLPANCITHVKGTDATLYVGTDIGVYYKDDTMTDWVLFSENLANAPVSELEIDYPNNTIVAATYGRGIWKSGLYSTEEESNLRQDENVDNIQSGLSYAYYEGNWDNLPNFEALVPVKEAVAAVVDLSVADNDNFIGLVFEGYVNIPSNGDYTFYLGSDDGSKMYVGDEELINNDGLHPYLEKEGTIGLEAGYHSIRIEFFERAGGQSLTFRYSSDSLSKQNVPASILFSDTNVEPKDCVESNSSVWQNFPLDNQTDNFEVSFEATPNTMNMDAVIGFSSGNATTYGNMGMIVRFNQSNQIDVRNGSTYAYTNEVNYAANDTFNFRFAIDFDNKKYDVYVAPQGGSEILLASQFNFRTDQANLSNVNNWATFGNLGALEVCDVQIDTTKEEVFETFCENTDVPWSGRSLDSSLENDFEISFEITPNVANIDGVVGLSNVAGTSYSDLAMIIRLNQQNVFDVRNGANYAYDVALSYQVGQTYTVKFEADIATRKYNVYVTPASGTPVLIAQQYDFRSNAPVTSSLNYWSWKSGVGNMQVCVQEIVEPILPEFDPSTLEENIAAREYQAKPQEEVAIDVFNLPEAYNGTDIMLSPVPAKNEVTLSFATKTYESVQIRIYDGLGKLVQSINKEYVQDKLVLDITNLSSGVYFVKAQLDEQEYNERLMVIK